MEEKKKKKGRKWKERRKKTANYSFIKYTHQVCVLFHKDKINIKCFLSVISLLCCFHCSVANLCPFFVTPWIAACQAPLSSTVPQSLLRFMSIESVMLSNNLILCCPFFCLQSFPASGSFPMSRLSWCNPVHYI